MECYRCGLAPCDLPDGIEPEDVFDRYDTSDGSEWLCGGCASGGTFTLISLGTDR
jgi:hypothetical protein